MEVRPGFSRWRRLRIALSVLTTAGAALAVWLLLNFVLTKPAFRSSLDLTRNAEFTISRATEELLGQIREGDKALEIHTFFRPSSDYRNPAEFRIHARVLKRTYDLLDRMSYLGGDKVTLEHHNIRKEIKSIGSLVKDLGTNPEDRILFKLGARKRSLHLLRDLADIEIPDSERRTPTEPSVPVLRGYKGEEAVASVLRELSSEEAPLVYWLTNHGEGRLGGHSGNGYSRLASILVGQGLRNKELDLAIEPEIPADCSLLMIMQPAQPVFDKDAALIRSYLARGGRVLLTLGHDRYAPSQLGASSLLAPYGLTIRHKLLLNGIPDGNGDPIYETPDCVRIMIRGGLSPSHPVTRFLLENKRYPDLLGARSLELSSEEIEGIVREPLLSTNPFAWEALKKPGNGGYDLWPPSARAVGTHHVGAIAEVTATIEGARPGRLVVISALAFLNGGFGQRVREGLIDVNQALAARLIDWLARRKSLVTVPARVHRSVTMDLGPEQREHVRLIALAMPLAFLLLSLFVLFWRRRA